MILFIFAMMDEAKFFIKDFNLIEEVPFKIYKKDNMVSIISGVGKVNSASATTYITQKYPDFKLLVNAGIVGGHKVRKFEKYIVNEAIYGDVDVTMFDYKLGQIPGSPESFKLCNELVLKLSKFNFEKIYSSDKFSTKVINELPYLADMEAAAIYHVAHKFNFNVISLKLVSDLIGDDNQIENYKKDEKTLDEKLSNFIYEVLEVL